MLVVTTFCWGIAVVESRALSVWSCFRKTVLLSAAHCVLIASPLGLRPVAKTVPSEGTSPLMSHTIRLSPETPTTCLPSKDQLGPEVPLRPLPGGSPSRMAALGVG